MDGAATVIRMCVGLTTCTPNAGQQRGLGLHGCSDGHSAGQSRAHSNTPPHFMHSPSPVVKCFTLADGKAFVSVSATMSSVGQYMRRREPCSMTQQMKW